MFAKDSGLLQGTVELLILKTLSWGPMHGYGIASWIESATEDVLRVEEGSLYPALYRMSRKGWIKARWGISENNRRAKFYHLTSDGRRQFREQISGWQRLAAAVSQASFGGACNARSTASAVQARPTQQRAKVEHFEVARAH